MSKPIFSHSAFRDFCARKPADEEYVWSNNQICACAQYGHELGIDIWHTNENGETNPNVAIWNDIAQNRSTAFYDTNKGHTFGELTKRMEEYIKETEMA